MIKFSIITIVKNREDTISRAIISVLSQDYQNVEYIIINGLSTDGTLDEIKKFKDPKITVISEQDFGIYDALNKGINNATGDVIGIMHSDDFYKDSNILSDIAKEFEGAHLDIVYGDVEYFSKNSVNLTTRYYNSSYFNPNRIKFGIIPAHTASFIKRNLLLDIGLYNKNFIIAGDFELFLRIFYHRNSNYKYIPRSIIRMQSGGLSNISIKSRLLINKEIILAGKINNINLSYFFINFRYILKIFEYILPKLKNNNKA
jgi:glycosyltransferase involved in cell wall biosynthesis